MFSSIKKMWGASKIEACVDGVIREAANGDAVELQKWYFKLKKEIYQHSLQLGTTAAEAERILLDKVDPSKVRKYTEVVQRLSRDGGVLEDINEWLKHNKPL